MPKSPPRRTCVAVLAGLILPSVIVASAAHADPGPTTPSQLQVDAAQRAVADAAPRVAELDQAYLSASQRLEEVQMAAAAAGEAYNGALFTLEERTAEADRAKQAAYTAQVQAGRARTTIAEFAARAYQSGGSIGDLQALLSEDGGADLLDRATALDVISRRRAAALAEATGATNTAESAQASAQVAVAQLKTAADDARRAKAAADDQAAAAAAAATAIHAQQQTLASELARLRNTSVQLEQQRQAGLLAQAQAKAAADEAARRAANTPTATSGPATSRRTPATPTPSRTTSVPRPSSSRPTATTPKATTMPSVKATNTTKPTTSAPKPTPSTSTPTFTPKPTTSTTSAPKPTSNKPASGTAAVIAYANAQLGKWYQWGGAGPNTFDCSGLTMMAWRQAGVYLSHYTGAQWAQTRRIPIDSLQPGDLVFFGPSGPTSTHVGLYIGSGNMIEAPHAGAQVRIRSIYRSGLLPYGGRP